LDLFFKILSLKEIKKMKTIYEWIHETVIGNIIGVLCMFLFIPVFAILGHSIIRIKKLLRAYLKQLNIANWGLTKPLFNSSKSQKYEDFRKLEYPVNRCDKIMSHAKTKARSKEAEKYITIGVIAN